MSYDGWTQQDYEQEIDRKDLELERLRVEMDQWSADAREVCGHDKALARLHRIEEAAGDVLLEWLSRHPEKGVYSGYEFGAYYIPTLALENLRAALGEEA